jgi:hypothetical protein
MGDNTRNQPRMAICALLCLVAALSNSCQQPTAEETKNRFFIEDVARVRRGSQNYVDTYSTINTDKLLASIEGLKGLKRLVLWHNDVTDAGMDQLSKFPDLDKLEIYDVDITEAGISKLSKCPNLKALYYSPHGANHAGVAAVLELPHLQKLVLFSDFDDEELSLVLTQLEQATNLKELTLVGGAAYSEERVAPLREKLPNCEIKRRSIKDKY